MPKIVASIEARMNASRLPGKVLKNIGDQPALTRLLNRLKLCKKVDEIVLATTCSNADDSLEQWAINQNLPFFRGSEEDVLQRVVDTHYSRKSDIVVEITGDCIVSDPQIIDLGIETFLANRCDVATTTFMPSFPIGIDVQVYHFSSLENIAKNVFDPAVREHVSLYFYENPNKYQILNILAPKRWQQPQLRLVLDYKEDLQLLNEIYRHLEPEYGESFGVEEILGLLNKKPELLQINGHLREKEVR